MLFIAHINRMYTPIHMGDTTIRNTILRYACLPRTGRLYLISLLFLFYKYCGARVCRARQAAPVICDIKKNIKEKTIDLDVIGRLGGSKLRYAKISGIVCLFSDCPSRLTCRKNIRHNRNTNK